MARKRYRKKNDPLIVTVLAYIITVVIFFYILRWIFRMVFSPVVIGTVVIVALIVGICILVKQRASFQDEDNIDSDSSVLRLQTSSSMPTRPLNEIEQMQIYATINQIGESKKLVQKTATPSVFFGRLNFCLDALLFLQQFEDSGVFGEATPTKDYKMMLDHLESTVNSFIDRALEDNHAKRSKLKTYEGQYHNYEDFLISLITAFDCADEYWSGNGNWPHYTGPLYTNANYQRVQSLYDGLDELYDPIIQVKIDSIINKHKQ